MSVAVLSIDPGSRATGVSLVLAGTLDRKPLYGSIAVGQDRNLRARPLEEQVARMHGELERLESNLLRHLRTPALEIEGVLVCVEAQASYRGSKVSPEDLLHLAIIAGVCAEWAISVAVMARLPYDVLLPSPRRWKEQREKVPHHMSTLRMMGVPFRLEYGSKVCIPEGLFADPNVRQGIDWLDLMDAVCLGDWAREQVIKSRAGRCIGLLVQAGARPLRWYSGPFPA